MVCHRNRRTSIKINTKKSYRALTSLLKSSLIVFSSFLREASHAFCVILVGLSFPLWNFILVQSIHDAWDTRFWLSWYMNICNRGKQRLETLRLMIWNKEYGFSLSLSTFDEGVDERNSCRQNLPHKRLRQSFWGRTLRTTTGQEAVTTSHFFDVVGVPRSLTAKRTATPISY